MPTTYIYEKRGKTKSSFYTHDSHIKVMYTRIWYWKWIEFLLRHHPFCMYVLLLFHWIVKCTLQIFRFNKISKALIIRPKSTFTPAMMFKCYTLCHVCYMWKEYKGIRKENTSEMIRNYCRITVGFCTTETDKMWACDFIACSVCPPYIYSS